MPQIATVTPTVPANPIGKIGLAFLPFTPVGFTGTEAVYAWARLGIYGMAAYLTWGKQKQLSTLLCAASAISLVTSLSSSAWKESNHEKA